MDDDSRVDIGLKSFWGKCQNYTRFNRDGAIMHGTMIAIIKTRAATVHKKVW
jgi:hypothetical protein